jgi:hypothetical protein
MRRLTIWMGRLPLAGKLTIRPLLFDIYTATSRKKRIVWYIVFMAVIVLSLIGHGAQAQMGLEAFQFHSPLWARAYSVLYACVNSCVVVVHAYLGYRTTRFLQRGRYPKSRRQYTHHSGGETATAFLVTMAGQLTFALQYIWYAS